MTHDAQLVDLLVKEPAVVAAVLFRTDRSILQCGAQVPAAELAELATTARHVFRETHPRMLALDLEHERGRAVLLPVGDAVLFLVTTAAANVQSLVSLVDSVEAIDSAAVVEPRRCAIHALNAVLAKVKQRLGGPVIRNYLKRAQRDLRADHPCVDALAIGLVGVVDSSDDTTDPAVFARAIGALTRAFLAQVSPLDAELGSLDVRAITDVYAADLAPLGFYESRTK